VGRQAAHPTNLVARSGSSRLLGMGEQDRHTAGFITGIGAPPLEPPGSK